MKRKKLLALLLSSVMLTAVLPSGMTAFAAAAQTDKDFDTYMNELPEENVAFCNLYGGS